MLTYQVITTEKVPLSYRVASVGSRFLAWLIDGGLIVLMFIVGSLFAGILDARRAGLGSAVMALAALALLWGYFLLFEWLWNGQTPGKRLLGIRVIDGQGGAVSFFQSAVRNVLRAVDSLPFFYGLGSLVAICNPAHRRLGDLAAGTLVIHVERRTRSLWSFHDGSADEDIMDSLARQRLGQLTRQQRQTMLDLSLRRDQLRVEDRARLFGAVAAYFKNQLKLASTEYQSDEKFVLHLVALLQDQPK
jgi:uncharacterized RDD family membrane protein YckC